jgi:hypothetical protein
MKLTQDCIFLMDFFIKNNFINHIGHNKQTNKILFKLYKNILHSHKKVLSLKKNMFYNTSVKKINNINEISKPKNFNSNAFPNLIREHIDKQSLYEITYTFSVTDRNITIHFVVEHDFSGKKIELFNKYVEWITMWLIILNDFSSIKCSKNLILYFYFTTLKKELPTSSIEILDQHNVNTAFTTTCPSNSEIVVFRKEEWFKVFIHETFHNFALDFSDMNTEDCHAKILSIFKVNSSVNLYEAYTEFWAVIINSLFCSFLLLKEKNDYNEFLRLSEFFINFEKTYSFFQLRKVLKFMNLSYSDLYENNDLSANLRKTFYREKTNVLSYYVIKLILLNNYQDFLLWCDLHNVSLFSFKKTKKNQMDFCSFIEKYYKSSSMLKGIENTNIFIENHSEFKGNKNNKILYLLTNLRMSLCEMC